MRPSREIYADILNHGLLAIRGAKTLDDAREIAYHLHNLPNLLLNLEHAGLHDYYWRIERPELIQKLGKEKLQQFNDLWSELEAARSVEAKIMK